ncbi:homocysteine S-methyltransferase family protein [Paludisphaera mucosa]|uniref:Homocysteine S-methyltransferase family protein n=1 Tax=Paludisphaera mucosa TaxID=3030827 RepID=A0ABT6F804_9BACT|nr:homocysteine S-methyltransferase family protein [Paludisphaera mucosa]MDG3003632.1 homocysteine S-methyltransferase family protein [Paludisphaera mucosa]
MGRLRTLIGPAPLVLDGGWATEFQARGLGLYESPDAWNLTRPDDVLAVARSYVEAGAQAILTNTFQANPISLDRVGRSAEARRINEEGARISRAAAGGGALVFGSLGPTGALSSPGSERRVADAFAIQAQGLVAGGVDALVLETFDVAEARVAARAALGTGIPVVASFYFAETPDGPRTASGFSPEEAVRAMIEEGVDGVGANCGAGIGGFLDVCRRMSAACSLPIWIKPNAGLPVLEAGRAVYAETPEAFAANLPALVEAGATCVGGCCGTTPAFVAALRREAETLGQSRAFQRDGSQR